LNNMRKRMQNIGGQVGLQSQPGQGTQVEMTVYIHNR